MTTNKDKILEVLARDQSAGWTSKELAEEIGKPQATVSAMLTMMMEESDGFTTGLYRTPQPTGHGFVYRWCDPDGVWNLYPSKPRKKGSGTRKSRSKTPVKHELPQPQVVEVVEAPRALVRFEVFPDHVRISHEDAVRLLSSIGR